VAATCAVTVKNSPKTDKTTLLKDNSGNQLYVNDNGTYREAVYADYYTFSNFYIKGDTKYTGWQTLSDGKVYYFTADGNMVTGEQVIQGAKYTFASDGSLVTSAASGVMGIDVSKWNGSIDWNAVKNSGVSYVIIRCGYRGSSQGALIDDPTFATNIKGATAAGLKVGVYFFTQAIDEVEAVEEASMVLDRIKGYKISYPVFLDVESSGGRADSISAATRTAVCKAFCATIQNAGYTAGVYANKTWFTGKINASELSAYKIWLAQYAETPTYSGRYDIWQYMSKGKVSGISGNVDMNLSYLGY
jgi:GH25 family lysozyme M1 (1,4-beta-N-acetylmuramidase)